MSKKINITINGGVHFYNNNPPQIKPPKKESWFAAITSILMAAIGKIISGL